MIKDIIWDILIVREKDLDNVYFLYNELSISKIEIIIEIESE